MNNKSVKIQSATIEDVEKRLMPLRGQMVLMDKDLAELYGVETRVINQAVKNNPDKFPEGYVYMLSNQEFADLKSKFLISNAATWGGSRRRPTVFTEKGLYMLATILKSAQATQTTLSIIETYAQVKEMVRTMETLQDVADGGPQQQNLLQKVGEMLANVVGTNLSTATTETEIEFNFAVVKIKHKIVRKG